MDHASADATNPDAGPAGQPGAPSGSLGPEAAAGADPGPALSDVPGQDVPGQPGPDLPEPDLPEPDLPAPELPGEVPQSGPEELPSPGQVPGSPQPDATEPQIPRLGEGGAAPGAHDPAQATADEPVTGADVAGGADAPVVGAGRAVEAAYAKRRPAQQQQQRQPGAPAAAQAQQQQGVQGAGYPVADRDGPPLVAGPGEEDELDDEDPEDDLDDDDEDEDDVEELQVGGDAPDPAAGMAPSEAIPEDAAQDVSVIGDGHADKAAWNRARTEAPQPGYDAVVDGPGRGTAGEPDDPGHGGGAPNEDVDPDLPGIGTGDGRLDELADDVEDDEEDHVEEQAGVLDDPSARVAAPAIDAADHDPDLPDVRDAYDEGVATEERLIAQPGEDPLLTLGELGDVGDLEMETLNEQDDIDADLEDQRADMDDAASGNERSAGL